MCIDLSESFFQHNWDPVQLPMLAPFLPDDVIRDALRAFHHRWRNSGDNLTPIDVVWSMIYRALHPDHSIGNTVAHLAACGIAISDSGWCQARSRLPLDLFPELVRRTALGAIRRCEARSLWRGRHVFIVDGTTVSMPDEPQLADVFGYTPGKHGLSRFPVARVVGILHAGSHTIADYRIGSYDTAENALWRDMIGNLPNGSMVLADCYYCTFPDFAILHRRGVDLVAKLHGRRDPRALIRQGFRLGRDEWLVPLETSAATRRANPDVALPDILWVRLIRHGYRHNGKRRVAWIATSLLDPDVYSKAAIVALYRSRWGVETHINYLKTTLDMSVLRSQTIASVQSEIGAIILAHNLTYRLMQETARTYNRSVARLSFAAAVKTALQTHYPRGPRTRRRCNYSRISAMKRLASRINPYRPGRIEPRLIKRDKLRYHHLRSSRADARKAA